MLCTPAFIHGLIQNKVIVWPHTDISDGK